MSQSGLKETGQAYCAYCSRETLIRYGGRQLLVCRKTVIRMEERTFSRANPAYFIKRIHFFARESCICNQANPLFCEGIQRESTNGARKIFLIFAPDDRKGHFVNPVFLSINDW